MSSTRRIDDIEILRAFAVLFVVLHHLNGSLYAFSEGSLLARIYASFNGAIGVDLFFAISGFVIARSMLPSFSERLTKPAFRNIAFSFWLRRIFRLLPSAWFWLGVILVLQVFFNESGVFGSLRANIEATVAAVLQVANIRFALGYGQFELGASFVYWSLSLEEQFYLVFPFLALLPRRKLIVALIVIIACQLFQARYLWLMMFRTDALCFGILIAMMQNTNFYNTIKHTCEVYPKVFSVLLIVLVALLPLVASGQFALPYYYISFVSLLCFFIVLIASLNQNIFRSLRSLHRYFIWVGSRSYAIYLIHIPVFYVVREIFFRLHISILSHLYIAITLSFLSIALLAELNFRCLEEPVRRWGAKVVQHRFGDSALSK